MKQVFVVLDCVNTRGAGLVYKVVEHISTFINSVPSWMGTNHFYSINADGSYSFNWPLELIEQDAASKSFYVTFIDAEGDKHVFRIERRHVY